MSFLCSLLVSFFALFGHSTQCTFPTDTRALEIYTHNEYSIEYPPTFIVTESSLEPVVTVKGPEGRLEIFRTDDFQPERVHGYSSSGIETYEATLVPKEITTHRDYTFWSFYTEGDMPTKETLDMIIDSFTQ